MSGYQRPDHFTRKAKAQGYAARSVFKLEEMDARVKLLRPGMKVVDLGCFPGSWSRYVDEVIGDGVLVGVDLEEPKGIRGSFIARSVYEVSSAELREKLGGAADVVLSDMAPNTSGDRVGDHLRQIGLAERALSLATELLRPGGAFVAKVFEGADSQKFVDEVKRLFTTVRRMKPEATRSRSVEFFVVATGFKG